MLGKARNWYHDTKIYSYLKHRKAERQQFEYDKWKLLFSLSFRPRNWDCIVHATGRIYRLSNNVEHMDVWIANSYWGIDFTVEGRKYGKINPWSYFSPWRRQVLKHGMRAAYHNPWINRESLKSK